MKKRLLSLLLCAAALFALGVTAAASEEGTGVEYLDEEGETQTCNNAIQVKSSAGAVTWTEGWYVVQPDDSGVVINGRITVTGNVHLILVNRCTLNAKAGIEVRPGNSLTIYAQPAGGAMGVLEAYGSEGAAGIGGYGGSGGTITINGGEVTATGGDYAAGIGSGGTDGEPVNSSGGTITINGGVVTAKSGSSGAGIGGGYKGAGGEITINGGVVTATGSSGAGIGGGYDGGYLSAGGTIIITGGTVTATSTSTGAGIGGGGGSEGGTIEISGGTVTAKSTGTGAGIGGGDGGAGGTITIGGSAKILEATSTTGAGIGGGNLGEGGTITITGGEVTATGKSGAGIGGGGGGGGDGGKITINGGVVTAISSSGSVGNGGGAGIGGGEGAGGGTIRINSGTVTVMSEGGADIGGGKDFQDDSIVPSELIEISDSAHVKRPDGGKLNIGSAVHGRREDDKWTSDGSSHWHPCKEDTCKEHQYDKASHDGAASCTGAGVCSVCGHTIPALGHSYGSLVPEQAATAESEGMKAHYRCGRCGQYFDESRNATTRDALVIPRTVLYRVTVTTEGKGTASAAPAEAAAGTEIILTAQPDAGWQFQEWRTDGPEIDEAGRFVLAESDVAVKAVFEEEVPVHVHDWETEWTTSSTHHWHECRAEGCEVTEDSGKDAYGAHTPGEWIVDREAGPYTAGERHKACTVCGFVTATEAIPATGGYEPGGGGSGGGSSDSSSGDSAPVTYPPVVERPGLGGSVEVSAERPKKGDTVTVTPKPDRGYEVDKVTVTGPDGKQVEVRKNPDGTFSFVQPAGKVTIEVTYQAVKPVEESRLFTDVGPGDWFYEAVRFVVEQGLMNGYADGRFGPDDRLSRGQLAQILYNKEGRPDGAGEVGFSDVTGGEWFADAVSWAAGAGIVGGYGDGRFGPNDEITREQLAVMLWRYAGSPAAGTELDCRDEEEVSGYAREALSWAVEKGILSGYGDGRLGPQGQATRAQAAQMLMNFMEKG